MASNLVIHCPLTSDQWKLQFCFVFCFYNCTDFTLRVFSLSYIKIVINDQLIFLNKTNDVAILLKIMILVLLKNTHITIYSHSCLSVYQDKFVMTHNNINNGCLWGVRLDKTINYIALLLCK